MDQQLGTVIEPQRHGMRGRWHRDHRGIGGCAQLALDRIDRAAVAHHPFGEHRIGHLVERREPPGKGRVQGHRPRHGSNSTCFNPHIGFTPRAV